MLTVDAGLMDHNPWLLNVRNGVVDLRDGSCGRTAPRISSPSSPTWSTVAWITCARTGSAPSSRSPVSAGGRFLRRWFGYCATGDISEQVFGVVHWGDGSNGKSTILNTVSAVLGDYARHRGASTAGHVERQRQQAHPPASPTCGANAW